MTSHKAFICFLVASVLFIWIFGTTTAQQSKLYPLYRMSTAVGGGFDEKVDAKQVAIGPSKVKYDQKTGIIYISDQVNNRIRKINLNGEVSTVAGNGFIGYSGDGLPATSALINNPGKVEISSTNEIYFADTNNHRIRKIFANGTITTIAGCGKFGFDLSEASPVPALESKINYPRAVLLSSDEKSLYITDSASHMIKSLSFETGLVSIIAGSLYRDSFNLTSVSHPTGLSISPLTLELHFVDAVGVKKITQDGSLQLVVGSGSDKFSGDGGLASLAGLSSPTDIEFTSNNVLFIADSGNSRIRVVGTNGIIETFAGNGVMGGSVDGEKAVDSGIVVNGLSLSAEGEVYFTDYARISMVGSSGLIRVVAGNGKLRYLGDGTVATQSQLFKPRGVAVSPKGELYISDTSEDTIRKVSNEGIITTFAGSSNFPTDGIIPDNVNALSTILNDPIALEFSQNFDELFVADSQSFRVRKISTIDNIISTVSNSTSVRPHGIAVLNSLVYVSDPKSNRVYKISQDGISTVIAGNGTAGYNGDSILAVDAQLFNVSGVAALPTGEIILADTNNHRIRKISNSGIIETIAGSGIRGFSGDYGLAINAQLNSPTDVKISSRGEIYIVDSNNHRIRKIRTDGTIVTVAGSDSASLSSDGVLSTVASMNTPTSIAISPLNDQLFIADFENRRVRRLDPFYMEAFRFNLTSSGELKTETIKTGSEWNGKNVQMKSDSIVVKFPVDFETQLNFLPELTLASSVYEVDKTVQEPSIAEKAVVSSIITLSILNKDGNNINLPSASSIEITFSGITSGNQKSNYTCMYYNSELREWKAEGVITSILPTNANIMSMNCRVSTLASFAIIDATINNGNERNVGGLSPEVIVAIVVPIVGSALLLAIVGAVVVLTTILLKKKHHPTHTSI